MSVRVKHGMKQSKLSDTPELQPHKPTSTPSETEEIQTLAPLLQSLESEKARADLLKLPSYYQPDRRNIFRQLYISHLVSSHDPVFHPWIPYLSDILTGPVSANFSAGILGIRAVSTALYGKLTSNKDLEIEASKWYSKGLEAQRKKLLEVLATDTYDSDATNSAICSAVVFSIFESIVATTPIGWLQHIRAAERMLDTVGPERCQSGLINMYFKSVRLASVSSHLAHAKMHLLISTVHFFNDTRTTINFRLQNMVFHALPANLKNTI